MHNRRMTSFSDLPSDTATDAGAVHPSDAALDVPVTVRACIEIAANFFGVAQSDLLAPARGRWPVAKARQLAAYLAHVAFGHPLAVIAPWFGRDRATLRFGCAAIEDMRDNPDFDRRLEAIERHLNDIGHWGER